MCDSNLVCWELNFEVAVKLGRMKNAQAYEAMKFYARFAELLLPRAGKIAFQALAKLPSARL
ncbi:hypothetical protein [Campylobacter gracilis]|uniref:Uncharacterized protein n=1 Tax=Campylobacter gracilis RM3268 TaxID=553220 RepID=C8PE61_9BACT|nr:hypothetical protein [Campylobacter gracilis]AKT92795.1 hypothetical protein CGRAC_1352 [Campylobacter gracilis]EEV18934.1 hypothetical protein CAMGR0001_2411 [Campylobacter gracilis RM3268]UEB45032.1 hypothetical protein LK410_08510 [Campylobacter gracilis]